MTIPDFANLDYLKHGTSIQQLAYHELAELGIMQILETYTPLLAGTIPLGIDIEGSDLDIICFCPETETFYSDLLHYFKDEQAFEIYKTQAYGQESVVANFIYRHFSIEIFGQNTQVKHQMAYRHMLIEYYILTSRGIKFKNAIIELKKSGIKTEPAFGILLNLEGNPYLELLKYESQLNDRK